MCLVCALMLLMRSVVSVKCVDVTSGKLEVLCGVIRGHRRTKYEKHTHALPLPLLLLLTIVSIRAFLSFAR